LEEQLLGFALKTAGHIGHPTTVAAFALLIAACVFVLALRAKRPLLAWVVTLGILVLGVSPWAASAFLQSRGIYHVQVLVVRPDQSSADIAQVKSSTTGDLKMVSGGWELDVPPQTRPADGKLTLSANVKDEFLKGETEMILAKDYYPTVTVQLVADTSAVVRGIVVDEGLRAVAGATVSINGYSNMAVTDAKGNFVLPAHAGKGQIVEVRAKKNQLTGTLSAPAGKVVEVVLNSE
jgi:hypothetical protein